MSSHYRPSPAGAAVARVLVVGEDAADRQAIYAQLHRPGQRCHQAASADEALVMARREAFDVAVMDLRLPGDCGAALRHHDPELAIVMVTDAFSADDAGTAIRVGAAGLLKRPFPEADLRAAVDRGLRWRRASQSARATRISVHRDIEVQTAKVAAAIADLAVISTASLESQFKVLAPHGRDTFQHGARTARAAVAIAQAMGCADEETAMVGWAALLHDIGKLALPAALLCKPGPLTDAEAAIVRRHPQIGADILKGVPLFVAAAEIVLASHEHFDGSGYPRGLRGSAIPLGARITCAADTVDALVSGRVYREPISSAQAAAELVRGAGRQFDPAVVHSWLRAAEQVGVVA